MAVERSPSWVKNRVYLPADGPRADGPVPAATAPPTRPVTRRPGEGTNARTVARPAQGVNCDRNAGELVQP